MPTDSGRHDVAAQIRNLLRVLREQWWLVALCLLLTGAGAYAFAHSQTKEYRATAKVLNQQENLTSLLLQAGPVGGDPVRQSATDTQLAAVPAVQARVAKRIGSSRRPAAVSAGSQGDANVIAVNVDDHDPAFAARYANAYADAYIVVRRDATSRRYASALKLVRSRLATIQHHNRRSPEIAQLRDQARQLQLLSSLQTGDAEVIQRAGVPTAAFKPRVTRTVIAGLLIGLALGIALAFLRDKLDRRLKSEDQVRELLPDVPVIGAVPRPGRGEKARNLVMESFHNLQANVGLVSPNGRRRTLLVTSAAPGEGKSTVCANLALAMAAHGGAPMVLEADLRRPALSTRLGVSNGDGVSRILVGEGTVAGSMRRTTVDPSRNGDGPRLAMAGEITLVPAGPTPPSPQVLLNAPRLEDLLAEARTQSDTVIVDGPPMGMFSDMLPVAQRVDGVILAVRLYHSRRDDVKRFAEHLADAGIEPIGVVVLGMKLDLPSYYSYSY